MIVPNGGLVTLLAYGHYGVGLSSPEGRGAFSDCEDSVCPDKTSITNGSDLGPSRRSAYESRFARLILERQLTPSQLRAVLIAALGAVLEPISSAAALAAWPENPNVIEFTRASTVLHIHLPPQISNFDSLDVDLGVCFFGR